MRTRALSIHADYGCRSSGACCTSAWAIAVEPEIEAGLRRAALDAGGLVAAEGLPGGARSILATDAHGACAFFTPATRRCRIHATLGHAALPAACRHFPRVALLAPDAVSVTLSHYCPTAAAMLFREDVPLAIVTDPPGFPPEREYEGLDARAAWPPLLRPGVLLGWDGHEAWERLAVATFARGATPEQGVGTLKARAAALARWSPAEGSLLAAFELETAATAEVAPDLEREFALVARAIPGAPGRFVPPFEGDWGGLGGVVSRYLAARAFASWVGLQGGGLGARVRALEAALAVLRVEIARSARSLDASVLKEALRQADLLLVHRASPEALARAWSA